MQISAGNLKGTSQDENAEGQSRRPQMANSLALCCVCDGRGRRIDPRWLLRSGLYQRRGHRDLLVHGTDVGRFRSFASSRAAQPRRRTGLANADARAGWRRSCARSAGGAARRRGHTKPRCGAALAPTHYRGRQERSTVARVLSAASDSTRAVAQHPSFSSLPFRP